VEGAMTSGASRRDSIVWASHYRAQAFEHLKRADAAFDERMEAHYRFLAQRFSSSQRRKSLLPIIELAFLSSFKSRGLNQIDGLPRDFLAG
jgi:hypothetical protein